MNPVLEQLQQACYERAALPPAPDTVEALARFVLGQADAGSAQHALVTLGHALDFLPGQDAWKRGFVKELERWSGATPEVWPEEIKALERELAAVREQNFRGQALASQAQELSDRLAAAETWNRHLKARRAELIGKLARYSEETAP